VRCGTCMNMLVQIRFQSCGFVQCVPFVYVTDPVSTLKCSGRRFSCEKCQRICTGPWKDSVPAFAELGFQCPQFKNPTDYFMKIASDVDNIPILADAQNRVWAKNGSEKFSGRATSTAVDGEAAETRKSSYPNSSTVLFAS
jgi:hypothetical protein